MAPIQTSAESTTSNSIYDLPSTEQAIKWMHTICGYPVKSTWLKAIKVGNYVGWPMLTEHNIHKYYPETIKTAKGPLNQMRKKTVHQRKGGAVENMRHLHLPGKKVHNMYTQTYMVHNTMFSDQTGQFPT